MQLNTFLKELVELVHEHLVDLSSIKEPLYEDILRSMDDNGIPFTEEMLEIDEDFDSVFEVSDHYSQYEAGQERYFGEEEDFE